ncbi:MAG TPA: inositol monophosphatase [Desulfonauticus sp.]|jgi:myo-inositol-1(or 4)-monophosphatase|nr:MAG: Inositol monophosphatase 2 [Desulfonauticus sp. 38_4375]MDK2921378.1 monophosphatase [Desulfonauticus sp.]HCO11720.1 inositol monophosphatase [Desulfonauticus sp.]
MKNWEKVKELVLEAGEIVKRNWLKPREINFKGEIDLVTNTDLEVEKFLTWNLKQLFPQASFLAEESALHLTLGEETFILDPLDGTTNFAHGFPFVAISLAYAYQKEIVASFLYLPILNELFLAQKGEGAFLNEKPISVSKERDLNKSLIATGFPYSIRQEVDEVLSWMKKILLHTQGLRRAGAAAIDLAYVACGRFEGFYEVGLKPWDTAAGWLLVEEAGGKVSTFANKPYELGHREILATNGLIHSDLSKLLTS